MVLKFTFLFLKLASIQIFNPNSALGAGEGLPVFLKKSCFLLLSLPDGRQAPPVVDPAGQEGLGDGGWMIPPFVVAVTK